MTAMEWLNFLEGSAVIRVKGVREYNSLIDFMLDSNIIDVPAACELTRMPRKIEQKLIFQEKIYIRANTTPEKKFFYENKNTIKNLKLNIIKWEESYKAKDFLLIGAF